MAARPNLSAMHQADDPSAVARRRDDAVEQMRRARTELVAVMSDLDAARAFEGEEWAPTHILWHLGGGHTHMEGARLILGGAAELPERDAAAELRDAYARVLGNLDDWIRSSSGFTPEQLVTHARRGNRQYYVVGMVESTAQHVTDHVQQIKDIKARIGERAPE